MRALLVCSALACLPVVVSGQQGDYVNAFMNGRDLAAVDPAASAEAMTECFRMALAAGNGEYAIIGGLNACIRLKSLDRAVDAGRLAREVLDATLPLPSHPSELDALRRVQLFGFLERGLLAEGKIGEARRANRAEAVTVRQTRVGADADGPPIRLEEIADLPPELRGWGWRVLEREANLLDLCGRSLEALDLLDRATQSAAADPRPLTSTERFYLFKCRETRAGLLDFLGYAEAAMEEQRALIREPAAEDDLRSSQLTAHFNLLRNLSQWEGPSQEILDQARAIARQMAASGSGNRTERTLARMEFDLKASREAADSLAAEANWNTERGNSFDATYNHRDALMARCALGEKNLDPEFYKLLATVRAHGNKRGEPTIHRIYGDYLMKQGRPAEAIPMFLETLRLTRSFGWVLHESSILAALLHARLESGDEAGARAVLAELRALPAAHPDMPLDRLVQNQTLVAHALARLGDVAAAKAAFQLAREHAGRLPDYQKSGLTAAAEERALRQERPDRPAAADGSPPVLRVQPAEIVTAARPGALSKTRFAVHNPTGRPLAGELRITGPGAEAGEPIRFHAGAADRTIGLPRTLAAGGEAVFEVTMAPADGVAKSAARVAWQSAGQAAGPAARWETTWDPAAAGSVVLDASSLEANPFRYLTLYHELAIPPGAADSLAFRLRSPIALRLEYYDAAGQLVAIDANGNGDFSEAGDLHVRGATGVAAAHFPIPPSGPTLTGVIHLFAPDGNPLATTGGPILLQAEVHRDGGWRLEAEDVLK